MTTIVRFAPLAYGSSPAKRGRGTMRSMGEGASSAPESAPLPAFGRTPPVNGGRANGVLP